MSANKNAHKRDVLVAVVNASEALVSATSDPRVPQPVRDAALRARYAAWGALGDHDQASATPKGA